LKVLQICHKMPFPQRDGGALSLYNNALGLLHHNIDLKVLAINTPRQWVSDEEFPKDFLQKTNFEYVRVDTRIKLLKVLVNLFSNESYFVTRFYSERFEKHLIRLLQKGNFDIVQLEHLYLCLYIDSIRRNSDARIILRPQNIEGKVWNELIENGINPVMKKYFQLAGKRLVVFENSAMKKPDGIIAISSIDEEMIRARVGNVPVTCIPFGLSAKKVTVKRQSNEMEMPVFYHLGSMDWRPNIQGINWFLNEIFPRLVEKFPGIRIRLAGKRMPQRLRKIKSHNLLIDGEVEDALTYHQKNDVLIVPLLSGSGIRVKIIEAMAAGNAVISTSRGAEGIPYKHHVNLLIANTAEEFIQCMAECISDKKLCLEIGTNARNLVLQHFDLLYTSKQMIDFYQQCLKN